MSNSDSKAMTPEKTGLTASGTGKVSVFFDFDNTITTRDVLDDIIMRFSLDKSWEALEEKWARGEIGSRECLEGQIALVRIDRYLLDRYLSGVKLDPYFKKLVELFSARNIEMMIVSDNFEYIIRRILENNSLGGLKVYSNSIALEDDRLLPLFPRANKLCGRCGHCKKSSMAGHIGSDGHSVYYIGDGRSDICPSKHASVIFAKDRLKEHCEAEGIEHIPIEGLKTVYEYFKRSVVNG
jgi:2,3-diketo-5-methylthio-1-phosphopentane phosphatase